MSDDDPTGNTAELIKNVMGKNSSAISTISSLIGTVADLAGAFGAASAVIGVVQELLGQPDPLQPILDALQQDFAQLFAALKARQNDDDWKQLNILVADTESVVDELEGLVSAQPPLTDEERLTRIQTSLSPLNALSKAGPHPPSPFFLAVYSEQVYWTDAGQFLQPQAYLNPQTGVWGYVVSRDFGYGTQAPPSPPDNLIFSYIYVLPYYLEAVFNLTAVGTALFADFGKTAQREQAAVIKFARFLTVIHDLIAGGIIKLSPAAPPSEGWYAELIRPRTFLTRAGKLIPDPSLTVPGVICNIVIVPPSLPDPDLGDPGKVYGDRLLFKVGAVEKFSGFSSFKIKEWNFAFPSSDGPIFQKLQIRALGEMMKVYVGVGLSDVRAAINALNKLADQPLMPPHKLASWSLREIFAIAGVGAQSDGVLHLSDLANWIRHTPPLDTSQTGPFSMRELLDPP